MNEKIVTTSIEILGKIYPVRCSETEVPSLKQAAQLLNDKMLEVEESGKAINLERIAIISALNIAHQLLNLTDEHHHVIEKMNQMLSYLQERVERKTEVQQSELMYASGDAR